MSETSSDFRDTLVELIGRSREPGDHPSPDRWLAYHRGELAADEEERIQEHLARCRDCFDLAAGAAAFAEADEEPVTRRDEEISTRPRRPSWVFLLPIAASFLVALAGLTAWNLSLQAPRANTPISYIAAVERASDVPELTVPAGPRMFVFQRAEELPVYRLVIRDAATGKELSSHELRPDADLALNLYLPKGPRPGRYRMEISDGSGKVRETVLLRVTEPGQGD